MNVLRGHWVYDKKVDENGIVLRLKARWVIDGSRLDESFSLYAPVVEFTSLRAILVWAVEHAYDIHVVDAGNAFLNSEMREQDGPVYMSQVNGYQDPLRLNYVCRLKKSLYGLPQSAANWNWTMTEGIKRIGFMQSRIDRCIFFETNTKSFLAGHVDDLVILGRENLEITGIKECIAEQFEIKDRGEISLFLGSEFKYNKRERLMLINQKEKIQKCYELIRSRPKPNKIPIQPNADLFKESEDYSDPYHYRSVVGLMSYIAQMTRPDLSFTASQFSRFMRRPTRNQYELLCKAVSFMFETKEHCLSIAFDREHVPDGGVHVFVDCGEPNIIENRCRRTTGIVQTYRNNVIGWSSKRQSVITGDIVEGELYALNSGLRRGLGTRNILDELDLLEKRENIKLHMYSDSKTASGIARDGFKTVKHYDQTLLYINEHIAMNQLKLKKVAGRANLADLLTKFVNTTQRKQLIKLFGMRAPDGSRIEPEEERATERESDDEIADVD